VEASLRFFVVTIRPATTPRSMALELSAILRIGFVVYALCSIEMTILLVGFDVFTRQRHLWCGCSRPSVGPVSQGLGRRTIMAGLGDYFRVSGAETG